MGKNGFLVVLLKRNEGRWLSSANSTLILNGTYNSLGMDKLGAYSCIYFEYHSKPG